MAASVVYITAHDENSAKEIGRKLVTERLAACANVLSGMTSVYRWEGKIEEAAEAVLIVKTRRDLVETVIARVRDLHEYDCPCIVSWPIEQGNPAYLQWIVTETKTA